MIWNILIKLHAVDTILVSVEVDGLRLACLPPLVELVLGAVDVPPVAGRNVLRDSESRVRLDRSTGRVSCRHLSQARFAPDVLVRADPVPLAGYRARSTERQRVEQREHVDGKLGGELSDKVDAADVLLAHLAVDYVHIGIGFGDCDLNATLAVVLGIAKSRAEPPALGIPGQIFVLQGS